jgi:hypothetical protein
MTWLNYQVDNLHFDKIIELFHDRRISRAYLDTYKLTFDIRLYLIELFETVMNTDPIIIEWLQNLELMD